MSHAEFYDPCFEHGDYLVCCSKKSAPILWLYIAHAPCGVSGVLYDRESGASEGGTCAVCSWSPADIEDKPLTSSLALSWDEEEFDHKEAAQFVSDWLNIPVGKVKVGRSSA